jgi:hypothetical protein
VISHGGYGGDSLHVRSIVASFLVSSAGLVACGCGAPSRPASAATPAPSTAASFGGEDRPLLHYRSRRLELTLPLPDGRAWRIDDHSGPDLVATHEPTRSSLVVSVFATGELVGRARCEELARSRRIVPDDGSRARRTVEDQVAITQVTYDTRIVVTLEPGSGPGRSLTGRVMAFGGFLRKCYAFVYSTEVDDATDEAVLSARLAFVRTRILRELELKPFDAVDRDAAAGPKLAPGP